MEEERDVQVRKAQLRVAPGNRGAQGLGEAVVIYVAMPEMRSSR